MQHIEGGNPAPAGPSWRSAGDYTEVLRRHVRLIVATVAVSVLVGLCAGLLGPARWTASAGVQVIPAGVGVNNPGGGRAPAGVNLDTEAAFMTSAEVVGTVAAQLGLDFETAREAVALSVPPNSAVIRIRFTADSAEAAREGASAVARTYLDQRTRTHAEVRDRLVREAGQAVELSEERLAGAAAAVAAALPESQAEADAQSVLDDLTERLAEQDRHLTELTAAPVAAGVLLRDADLPTAPSSPDVRSLLGGSVALGLLAGSGWASVLERGGRSRTGHRELERAGVPLYTATEAGLASEDAVALGRAVGADRSATPTRFVVTSSAGQLPADDVALSLARSLARTGLSVVAVLVAPGRAAAVRELDLLHRPGLAELLEGADPDICGTRTSELGGWLTVLGPGVGRPDVRSELLGPRGQRALDRVTGPADVVVVAPGPVDDSTAVGLAALADAVVAVVPSARAGADVRATLHLLSGVRLVAAVAVGTSVLRQPGGTAAPATAELASSRR